MDNPYDAMLRDELRRLALSLVKKQHENTKWILGLVNKGKDQGHVIKITLGALLLSLLLALPARATQLYSDTIGTIASGATDTGDAIFMAGARAPLTLVVYFTSVNAQNLTVSIEGSGDGTNWAVPSLVAATPATTLNEVITGNGSYICFPIALVTEQGGGVSNTADLLGMIGPWIRVKLTNAVGSSITNVRTFVYSN